MTVLALLLVAALLLGLFRQVLYLKRSQAPLWDVLLRSETRQQEQARSLAALAVKIEANARAGEEASRLITARNSARSAIQEQALISLQESVSTVAANQEKLWERLQTESPPGPTDNVGNETDFGVSLRTESENLRLAKSLAFVRPLVPYPGWHFNIEMENTDLAFRMRRQLWRYFNSRRLELPLEFEWYDGIRLNLYLGNDLSGQLFVGGSFEPNEFAFLDKILKPGMTFLDAGANDGLYTLFASRRVGPSGEVWAVEPSDREFHRLEKNLLLNQVTNVRAFPIALADFNGEADLAVAGYEHEGQNTLGAFVYDVELLHTSRVPVRRLDDLAMERSLTRLDVIKADVEGAEFRLLDGARATLEKMRPAVLLELSEKALRNQGASREMLLTLLLSCGYCLYGFDENTGQPAPAEGRAFSSNMLALPSETPLPDWSWI